MALSNEEKNFVKDLADGKLDGLHISDREGLILLGKVMNRMEANASLIQWNGGAEGLNGAVANTEAVANGLAVESSLKLSLTDLSNKVYDDSANDYTVVVTPTGAAANKEYSLDAGTTWVAWAAPLTVTLVDGEVEFMARADYSTNAMILTLSAPSGSKSIDSTYTITGS